MRKPLAYVMSLVVLGSALWMPTSAFAQVQLLGAGGGGVAAGGSAPDNAFFICDDVDPTKCGAFQASGISTGTTRTFTFPNANSTLAVLGGVNQTWTAGNTFSSVAAVTGKLTIGDGSTITVDGATTFVATTSYHVLACTGAETINTITGGTGLTGMQLVLLNNDTDCTIADDDTPTAANAINLTGTATNDVGAVGKHLTFIFDGNAWQQISESANN